MQVIARILLFLLAAAGLAAAQSTAPTAPPAPARGPNEIKILSAVFGNAAGAAEVTPLVQQLVQPDLDEFFAAPKWLTVDPAMGTPKELTIAYEFRGQPKVFTTPEGGAVSYAILADQANPQPEDAAHPSLLTNTLVVLGLAKPMADTTTLKILAAYYGYGGNFTDVTGDATQALPFTAGAPATARGQMLTNRGPAFSSFTGANLTTSTPAPGPDILVLTYELAGRRRHFLAASSQMVNYDILSNNAQANGLAATHSDTPPPWLASAHPQPMADLPPVGKYPHGENALAYLATANFELRQLGPDGDIQFLASSLADAQLAAANLRAALVNAEGKTPGDLPTYDDAFAAASRDRVSSQPVPEAIRAAHLASAITALNLAVAEARAESAANRAAYGPRAIANIQQALADARRAKPLSPAAKP